MEVGALGVGPAWFRHDFKTFGFVCESLVPRVCSRPLGGAQAYTRPDGVHVVPVSALRP